MKRPVGRGQLVVEFVLSLAVWTAVMSGMIFIARVVILKHRAHQLARLGTFLQSTGRLRDADIQKELLDFAIRLGGVSSGAWRIETGRFMDTAASHFYRLVKTRVEAPAGKFGLTVADMVVSQEEPDS